MSSGIDYTTAATIRSSPWSRPLARFIEWRHWKLWVKLAAIVLVPMIFAATASIVQIEDLTTEANAYTRLDGVVRTAIAVRTVAADLQQERDDTAGFLADGAVTPTVLRQRFAESERASQSPAFLRNRGADEVRSAHDDAIDRLAALPALRDRILARQVDPMVAMTTYTAAIGALLDLDRTLVGQMSSVPLSTTATTQHELARVGEEVRLQHALMSLALTGHDFTPAVRTALGDSETRRAAALGELRAAVPSAQRPTYDSLFTSPDFVAYEMAVHRVLTARDDPAVTPVVDVAQWTTQHGSVLNALSALQTALDGQLRMTAFSLQDDASNMAGAEAVIFLSALLVTGAIGIVVTRQLVGSLDLLRRSALDTANKQLPQAVRNLRTGTKAAIGRVPVDTGEEIGEVARAFDAVHAQAVHLASEQAELRKSYRDSFVNVSRRSQSLLERQLRLFEQLERDEEDPDQLSTLFQLDHLATRMRRNNENLMVLSGADPTRRFTKPTSPADLLRAAVSEIEHYPRVLIQPLPTVTIAVNAASDMVRLLAELLDNATSFSAPQSTVTVSGHRRGDGSLGIELVDRGIGMGRSELADANRRLATDGGIELSTSRRLGLFVAGRLAARHGIGVELHPGADNVGIRAAVTIRADLLVDSSPTPAGAHTNGFVPERENGSTLTTRLAAVLNDTAMPAPTRNGFHFLGPESRTDDENHSGPDRQQEPGQQQEPNPQLQTLDEQPQQAHSLFSPATEPPAHSATDDRGPSATTPIFDGLAASAWFHISRSPNQVYPQADDTALRWPARPADEPDPATDRWTFDSDSALHRAEEISTAAPDEYTAAGLPRRIPQAHLLAGSVPDENRHNGRVHDGGDTVRLRRDPDSTRDRLSSFQQGSRRGRESPHNTSCPNGAIPSTMDDSESWRPSEWKLVPDAHPHRGQHAANTAEFDYTHAGLPRRNPRLPATPPAQSKPEDRAPHRDARSVRGRLTSFQRGVREGRHRMDGPAGGTPGSPW